MNEMDHEIRACLYRMATGFQILEKRKKKMSLREKKRKDLKDFGTAFIDLSSKHTKKCFP
jgi:hypothetical protein